jgi:hypothetical protein
LKDTNRSKNNSSSFKFKAAYGDRYEIINHGFGQHTWIERQTKEEVGSIVLFYK